MRMRLQLGIWSCAAALGLGAAPTSAEPPSASVEVLLDTDQTVLDQPFFYPEGIAVLRAERVTLPPGAETIWHLHPVPLFAYVLRGELIVDYGSEGERVYRPGDAFVEAFDWPHRGRNGGRGLVELLVVYAGADGVPTAVPADPE